jgi:hypothetical protein
MEEELGPMETEVFCPDCGKVIAAPGEIEESRRCQCAQRQDEALSKAAKVCYICGKSLEGRTRLKDKLGRYWCKKCAAADERAKKRVEELRCPDCGRVFPEAKLVYFQTERVCSTCHRQREKAMERRIARIGLQGVRSRYEWDRIKWLALAFAILVIAAALRHYFF